MTTVAATTAAATGVGDRRSHGLGHFVQQLLGNQAVGLRSDVLGHPAQKLHKESRTDGDGGGDHRLE